MMPDPAQMSDVLHQLFYGWFSLYPTLAITCIGILGTFAIAARWGKRAVLFMAAGTIIVTLPQLVPFLRQFTPEAREHGVSIWGNLRVFKWLVIGSELIWWPPVSIAYWFGIKAFRSGSMDREKVFE
jgi:hypothetical protein